MVDKKFFKMFFVLDLFLDWQTLPVIILEMPRSIRLGQLVTEQTQLRSFHWPSNLRALHMQVLPLPWQGSTDLSSGHWVLNEKPSASLWTQYKAWANFINTFFEYFCKFNEYSYVWTLLHSPGSSIKRKSLSTI